jgi:glucosamine--fructose-6-phosphate aminotransferase (isomerizing)
MDAEVMLRQVRALGDDVRRTAPELGEKVAALLAHPEVRDAAKLRAVGCGDSLNAAISARLAFGSGLGSGLASDYSAVSAFEYAAYSSAGALSAGEGDGPVPAGGRAGAVRAAEIVLGISASGGTPAVLDAVRAATARGAVTVAITGREDSALGQAADHSLVVSLPDGEPSPGIRTFTASLLALLTLAGHWRASRGAEALGNDAEAIANRAGASRPALAGVAALHQVAGVIDATNAALDRCAAAVLDAIADAPAVLVAGSGPGYGIARHAAAKLVEGAGVLAVAQDLEEWRHVERFAAPADLPLIVIAQPGRSAGHAADIARFAASLGRRVIAVAPEGSPIAQDGHPLLPVTAPVGDAGAAAVPEELSPLVYQLFAPHLACHWANRLGRRPFHEGEPGYRPPR